MLKDVRDKIIINLKCTPILDVQHIIQVLKQVHTFDTYIIHLIVILKLINFYFKNLMINFRNRLSNQAIVNLMVE